MHRVRGELFSSMHDEGAAEASFRKAINVAQHQSAKTWELRAATSLARLATPIDPRVGSAFGPPFEFGAYTGWDTFWTRINPSLL